MRIVSYVLSVLALCSFNIQAAEVSSLRNVVLSSSPIITGQNAIVMLEDSSIELAATDFTIVDDDSFSHSIVPQSGLNYTVSGSRITPRANYFGTLQVPVTASDGVNTSPVYTALVQVQNVNDAPVALPPYTLTLKQVGSINFFLTGLFSDKDGVNDTTIFYLLNNGIDCSTSCRTQNGTLTKASNHLWASYYYVPDNGYKGTDYILYSIKDSDGAVSNVSRLYFAVSEPASLKISRQNPISMSEDTALQLLASQFVISGAPQGKAVSIIPLPGAKYTVSNNQVVPAKDYFGELIVDVIASAGGVSSGVFKAKIQVQNVNDAPIALEPYTFNVEQNGSISFYLSGLFGDKDGVSDSTVFYLLNNGVDCAASCRSQNGTITKNANHLWASYRYQPDSGFSGTDYIQYSIRDSQGAISNVSRLNFAVAGPAAEPVVHRFEWVPAKVMVGEQTTFYWNIENVTECTATTAGVGSPTKQGASGESGPWSYAEPEVHTTKWFCTDINGNRFPSDPNSFLEATRTVIERSTDPDFVDAVPVPANITVPNENSNSALVNSIAGNFSVTNQGASTHNIPLDLIQGVGRFTPELSLNYSSLASNGDAGLGWSLSAVSSLSRCQKVLEEDGLYQEISFTNSDALCLGGEKLRLVSGSNLTSGAEYRLDKQPDVKVVQSSSGAGSYFTVYRPNGDMQTYGDSDNSVQIDAISGMPHAWLQSAHFNLFGQKIEYQYQRQQDYAPLLKYILYADNQIEVVYEDRPDASTHYYLGNKLIYNSRIADIIIRNHSNQAIRSYHLGYKQSSFSNRSLLQTVQMCNGTRTGVCGQVTQLNYSDYDYAGLQSQETLIDLSLYSTVQGKSDCKKNEMYGSCPVYKLQVSDFDDNGKRELFVSSLNGETGKIFAFEFSGESFTYQSSKSLLNVDLKPFKYTRNLEPIVYHFPWRLIDTDGDGVKEINYGYSAYYDWDGDGVDELTPGQSTPALQAFEDENTYTGNYATDYYIKFYGADQKLSDFVFDYNGDGLLDRAVPVHFYREMYDPATGQTPAEFLSDDFVIELNQSVGQNYAAVLVPYSGSKYINRYELSGDLNGDGILDYQKIGGEKRIKTGRNFADASVSFDAVPPSCGDWSSYNNCLEGLADIDGDGKDDIVYVYQQNIYWRQSLADTPAAAVQLGTVSWPIRQTDPYMWADLDGDDQPELIYFDIAAQKVHIRFDRNINNEVLDKLISIENGLGKDYSIEYSRLNDPQVYQKGTGASAVNWGRGSKVRDIVSTMPVVAKVTEVTGLSQSGQPLRKEIKYSYKSMKTQAGGRGALGFAEVTTDDITAKTKTIKYFRQDPPYNGLLSKSEVLVDGQLAERNTVLSWWNLPSNNNQSRFIAPRKQQTDKYYLNADYGDISSGVAASTTVVETTFEMTAANYPRVNSTLTTLSDLLNSGISSQTVSYEYTDEDLANWRIKRPTRTVTSRSRSGQRTINQIADSVYNTNGSVQQVIQEPDSSDASVYLQTFMRYDDKGNLIEQTQCSLHFAQNCGEASVPATDDNTQKVFRRKTFVYDSAGRYLTKINNPHYTEQSFHNFNKLGQAQEVRFNQYDSRAGQREFYRYDSFGERYFSYNNQGSSSKLTKQLCSNRNDCPANAVFAVVMSSPNQPDGITYLDNSGNTVRQAAQLLDGRWSLIDTVYDSQSRSVKVSKPYIIGQTTYHETINYDALGRKDTVQSADDLTTRFSYYAGKVTQYITGSYSDEASSVSLDRTREEQHNGLGEVIYSTDSLANSTHFTYTALGLPETVTGVDSAVTSLSYDNYGRRTGMNDPDKGNINYGFNALGEDVSRTSPDGVVKTHYRNAIGQTIRSTTVQAGTTLTYLFNYGNTPFIQQQSHDGSVTSYSYDSFHRPSGESYQLDNKSWTRTYFYDEYGRLFRDMDIAGNGYGQQYQYAYGHMNRIFEVKTGQAYYRMLETDAYQNLTQAEAANHIQVERDYDAKSGRLTGLFAGFGLIQHQYYRYDQLGNLRYRSNLNAFGSADLIESFGYDELNRLETVTFNGTLSQQMTYLDNGNILTKSDVENAATYQYGSKASSCSVTPGVHAVSQIGTRRFCYDARGNQTHRYVGSSVTRRVDYTAFDKPHSIWSNQGESRFSYDATEKLVKRIDKKAGGDMVTYYIGGHEAIYQPDGSSEIKRYIRDIAIHSIKSTGASTLHYVFNDHLGSGSVITDTNGNVVETASFDAFGKRRNANNWQGYTNPFSQLTNLAALLNITQKGYTGHIQVDHAAVIHMGGRIYDPELGRFMQADPIVQDPRDAQSLNRYSYVYNNPLSYTDPTGYSTECGAKPGDVCPSAIEQQKQDVAKAAQTQGSSKPEEVSNGNQSANLQNAAKVASGSGTQPSFLSSLATNIVEGMGMMLNNPFVDVANAQMDVQRAELEGNPDSVDAAKVALVSTTLTAVVMAATPSPTPGGKPKVDAKNNPKSITISKSRFPESAKHIEDAVADGKTNTLTIDRANASTRRREALHNTKTRAGLDRDEFPPAMFQEGGQGSSVRHINPSDNRGAGACIGAQCRSFPDGTRVRIDVVD